MSSNNNENVDEDVEEDDVLNIIMEKRIALSSGGTTAAATATATTEPPPSSPSTPRTPRDSASAFSSSGRRVVAARASPRSTTTTTTSSSPRTPTTPGAVSVVAGVAKGVAPPPLAEESTLEILDAVLEKRRVLNMQNSNLSGSADSAAPPPAAPPLSEESTQEFLDAVLEKRRVLNMQTSPHSQQNTSSSASQEGVVLPEAAAAAEGVGVGITTTRSSRKARHSSPHQEGLGVVVGAVHAGGGVGGGEEEGSAVEKGTMEGTETTEGETERTSSSSSDVGTVPPPTTVVERTVSGLTDASSSPNAHGALSVREGESLAVARKVEDDDGFLLLESGGMDGPGRNIPMAVEYDPDSKPPLHKTRRFRLYAFLAFVILVAIVVGVTVGVVLCKPEEETEEPTSYRETLGIEAEIKTIVSNDLLQDPESPYSKALEWITFNDPMQLLPNASNFIQRYTAAYFYFATTVNGPYRSCNPPNTTSLNASSPSPSICMFETTAYAPVTYQAEGKYSKAVASAWLSGSDECGWGGITCDENDQVRMVLMYGSGLSGPFPEGIYHWPFLQNMVLSYNSLRGPLPAKLTETMEHLSTIWLSDNQFTGTIPDQWWRASHLHVIDVGQNNIEGTIPTEIGILRDLKTFSIGNNSFTGVLPTEIGMLDSISVFDVSGNSLVGEIPTTIENWKTAADITLQRNHLVGPIPDAIGKLSSLSELNLQNNDLTGKIPDSLYELSNLQRLFLSDCNLSGTLSPKIANLKGIWDLQIANNKFIGSLPTEFAALSDLQSLWLQGNAFTGIVPEDLCSHQKPREADDIYSVLGDVKADCAANGEGYVELGCSCCTECCQPGGTDCSRR